MLALCFKCGGQKTSALKLCKHCQAIPKEREELVLSLCLSLECVQRETLTKCRKYFQKKDKPPRFKENIVKRANEFLEEQMDNSTTNNSIEFSSSIFDFQDLSSDSQHENVSLSVTVHIIGKGPKQDSADVNASLGKTKGTYHRARWVVGRDIPEDDYMSNKDPDGDLYVWYRWINNSWNWTCISSSKFQQLKSVESGRPG